MRPVIGSHPAVITYDEDTPQLGVQLVEPAKLGPAAAAAFKAPILLDDFDFKLDDEFARRFGASMLSLIALGQPGIKHFMSVRLYPLDSSGNRQVTDDD